MVSKIRLVLKAFALGRYILSHQRSMFCVYLLSCKFRSYQRGLNLLCMDRSLLWRLPGSYSLYRRVRYVLINTLMLGLGVYFRDQRFRKRLKFYVAVLLIAGVVSYEYHSHQSIVPITNRKHFVV